MNVEERVKSYIATRKAIKDKAREELKKLDDEYRSEIAKYVPIKVGDVISYHKSTRYNTKEVKAIVCRIAVNTSGGFEIYVHVAKLNGEWSKRETYYDSFNIYGECEVEVLEHDDNYLVDDDSYSL